MNRIHFLPLCFLLLTGCASSTVIRSHPAGATVRDARGNAIGRTPYHHSDTRMTGHRERFVVELEDHEPQQVVIRRDRLNAGRAVAFGVGGILLWPVWTGLLWMSDYEDEYQVTLQPETPEQPAPRPRRVAQQRR
jgi:hypothetical protein